LPALTKCARDRETLRLPHNLKQIGLALYTYSSDAAIVSPARPFTGYAVNGLTFYRNGFNLLDSSYKPFGPDYCFLGGYLKGARIFYCPGRTDGDRFTYTGPYPWTTTNGWCELSLLDRE